MTIIADLRFDHGYASPFTWAVFDWDVAVKGTGTTNPAVAAWRRQILVSFPRLPFITEELFTAWGGERTLP